MPDNFRIASENELIINSENKIDRNPICNTIRIAGNVQKECTAIKLSFQYCNNKTKQVANDTMALFEKLSKITFDLEHDMKVSKWVCDYQNQVCSYIITGGVHSFASEFTIELQNVECYYEGRCQMTLESMQSERVVYAQRLVLAKVKKELRIHFFAPVRAKTTKKDFPKLLYSISSSTISINGTISSYAGEISGQNKLFSIPVNPKANEYRELKGTIYDILMNRSDTLVYLLSVAAGKETASAAAAMKICKPEINSFSVINSADRRYFCCSTSYVSNMRINGIYTNTIDLHEEEIKDDNCRAITIFCEGLDTYICSTIYLPKTKKAIIREIRSTLTFHLRTGEWESKTLVDLYFANVRLRVNRHDVQLDGDKMLVLNNHIMKEIEKKGECPEITLDIDGEVSIKLLEDCFQAKKMQNGGSTYLDRLFARQLIYFLEDLGAEQCEKPQKSKWHTRIWLRFREKWLQNAGYYDFFYGYQVMVIENSNTCSLNKYQYMLLLFLAYSKIWDNPREGLNPNSQAEYQDIDLLKKTQYIEFFRRLGEPKGVKCILNEKDMKLFDGMRRKYCVPTNLPEEFTAEEYFSFLNSCYKIWFTQLEKEKK